MKIRELLFQMKPPCPRCLYTLGLVHTLKNPCRHCKENSYQTFKHFQKQAVEKN